MADNPLVPLYLFAKQPLDGKVKTRMQPQLPPHKCIALAQMMLQQSVQKVAEYWPGRLVLCVTPSVEAEIFDRLSSAYNCECVAQIDANLGDRMLHALQQGIASGGKAAVMGCDVPHIPPAVLAQAHRHLQRGANVIGAAEDGGFYMLGVNQFKPQIFDGVDWGAESVSAQVITQAGECDMQFELLDTLRDIDRWHDLLWLARHDARYAEFI